MVNKLPGAATSKSRFGFFCWIELVQPALALLDHMHVARQQRQGASRRVEDVHHVQVLGGRRPEEVVRVRPQHDSL
jgi:hypothetical protein